MTRLRRSVALAAAVAAASAACGGGSDADSTVSRSDAAEQADTEPGDTEPGDTRPADIEPAATDVATTAGNDTVDAGRCAVIVGEGEYEPIDCHEPHDAEFAGTVAASVGADPVSLMVACATSVEALAGRPLTKFGIDVGSAVIDGGDEAECWGESAAPGTLSASILDDGLDAAIGDAEFVTDLDDGTCFVLVDPAAFDLATVVDCDAPDAEMLYGQFEAHDGPVPDDETVDAFFASCDGLESTADFEVIGTARYIISPLADDWEALDRRTVLCIAWNDPAEETTDASSDIDPASASGPVCAIYDEALADYPEVPCDEPHDAEFAGAVTPPVGDLPVDEDEASILLRQLCREPVEQLTGRDLGRFGVGVGFVSADGLGEPMVNDIRCYVSSDIEGSYVGAIAEVGYDDALKLDIIADLPPGTCFVFVDDNSFEVGETVRCDASDALMAVGFFFVEEPPGAPHPGDDALRGLRAERCSEILSASGLAADPSTVSGTFPNERNWEAFDRRQLTCDAAPL